MQIDLNNIKVKYVVMNLFMLQNNLSWFVLNYIKQKLNKTHHIEHKKWSIFKKKKKWTEEKNDELKSVYSV